MEVESKSQIHNMWETAGDFVDARIDLLKMQGIKKTSEIVSSLTTKIVLAVVFFFFITLLNIGIALVLGEWLGKLYYGFFILAVFYLIVGLIFNAFKSKWIQLPVANSLIKKAFK